MPQNTTVYHSNSTTLYYNYHAILLYSILQFKHYSVLQCSLHVGYATQNSFQLYILLKCMYVLDWTVMDCMSLWIKAYARCINVNVN